MASDADKLRGLLAWVIPHGLYLLIRSHQHRRRLKAIAESVRATMDRIRRVERPVPISFSRQDVMDFLCSLGLDSDEVNSGSVPDRSLTYCCQAIKDHLPARPLRGLHIGNFVGISLCHFTDFIRRLDERSTMVSIDPNLPHRGIHHPIDMVMRCLARYGLQGNSLILTGYSLEKSVSNDGVPCLGYEPGVEFSRECSGENQLLQLACLLPECFDFAFIDGNHEAGYLAREIELIVSLLKPEGLLILDDVNWDELGGVYRSIDPGQFEHLDSDGRAGLVRKRSGRSESPTTRGKE